MSARGGRDATNKKTSTRLGKPYEGRESPGKGLGMFAARDLPSGTLILQDKAVAPIRAISALAEITDDQVQRAFEALSPDQQKQFLTLHEGTRSALKTKLLRIYESNCFSDNETSWIYLTQSGVNHSCTPNAENETGPDFSTNLYAIKPIAKDQEIFITYQSFSECATAQRRNKYLQFSYGFSCTCKACTTDRVASDVRRQWIYLAGSRLEEKGPMDLSFLDTLYNDRYAETPQTPYVAPVNLSPSDRTLFAFILAQALELEGLAGEKRFNAYVTAAATLMARIRANGGGNTVAVDNVSSWLTKCVTIVKDSRPPGHPLIKQVEDMLAHWKAESLYRGYCSR